MSKSEFDQLEDVVADMFGLQPRCDTYEELLTQLQSLVEAQSHQNRRALNERDALAAQVTRLQEASNVELAAARRVRLKRIEELEGRSIAAIHIAFRYGQISGDHHRLWVIDQMLRALLGEADYQRFTDRYEEPDADGETYGRWETGIAP